MEKSRIRDKHLGSATLFPSKVKLNTESGYGILQCCGSGMFIPDPAEFFPSRIPGLKVPDPDPHGIRIKKFK
jgi:hypothetical protein